MVASKRGRNTHGYGDDQGGSNTLTNTTQTTNVLCCMCGDTGITEEIFRCTICKFRSQHKYCSNQYPTVISYEACNWCLHTAKPISGNSSNSSSSLKRIVSNDRRDRTDKNKRNPNEKTLKKLRGSLPKDLPVAPRRKRVASDEAAEKNQMVLRKSKSENHIDKTKQGFRPKVRRQLSSLPELWSLRLLDYA
nr:hypothetical protein [Tanacetum cinerariifolium]